MARARNGRGGGEAVDARQANMMRQEEAAKLVEEAR